MSHHRQGRDMSHHWQGRDVTEEELPGLIDGLVAEAGRVTAEPTPVQDILAACGRVAADLADPGSELHRRLTDAGVGAEEVHDLAVAMTPDALRLRLARELGDRVAPGTFRRPDPLRTVYECWAPLGVLVHVAPSNAPAVGVLSVVEGLLTGNLNVLKVAGGVPSPALTVLPALCRADPGGAVARRTAVLAVPSSRRDILGPLYACADGVAVWGGEEAERDITAQVSPGCRVVAWGHRLSFAYLTPEAAGDDATLAALARDIDRFGQQACSSPQVVYLDTEGLAGDGTGSGSGDDAALRGFRDTPATGAVADLADRLAGHLDRVTGGGGGGGTLTAGAGEAGASGPLAGGAGEAGAEAGAGVSGPLAGDPLTADDISEPEQAEITTAVEVARFEACLGLTEVTTAPDGRWRVIADRRPVLAASPLHRTVSVRPLPRSRVTEVLRPMRRYLQTVGIAGSPADVAALSRLVIAAGADRVTPVGGMTDGYPAEPHDGLYPLQRFSRRVSVRRDEPAFGAVPVLDDVVPRPPDPARTGPSAPAEPAAASGPGAPATHTAPDETAGPSAPAAPTATPLLTKEAVQAGLPDVPDAAARLYVRTGGSSGAPALSLYTYPDYTDQMRAVAEGLLAAGFDPARRRVVNLFFGGSMYGGFLSFFTVLEQLNAVQLPVAATPDYAAAADAVIRHGADTLFGMPSYLWQLLHARRDEFRRYGRLRALYYGGEHLTASQRRVLREDFGITEIRSATYGSTDLGPLGYQCRACEGSEHHIHASLVDVEVVDVAADRPVPTGEVGRLVFTSRLRQGQRLERYLIGDLGRILPGPCACGSTVPRIELLGRHGDVVRVGAYSFHHGNAAAVLEERLGYSGEMQFIVTSGAERETLTVVLDERYCDDPGDARRVLDEDVWELAEAQEDGMLTLDVVAVDAATMVRTPTSGKLRKVVDRR
ncbi:acyl-CoA reductase [Corynebacterium bovis]|uniref:acyl-CoA reductase n=1 Tax=Corynebacterium bovis TaxID=36808 RepID=UPI002653E531|nr:acyl-CoA reductase [Corynebacterium bovis]MDN8580103.1 acyl-CoA reductase [Corynebacterium bovis]